MLGDLTCTLESRQTGTTAYKQRANSAVGLSNRQLDALLCAYAHMALPESLQVFLTETCDTAKQIMIPTANFLVQCCLSLVPLSLDI